MDGRVTRRAVVLGAAGFVGARLVLPSLQRRRPGIPVVLQPSGDFVWTMAVSPSGRFAASGHVRFGRGLRRSGGGVVVWDLDTGRARGRYQSRLGVSTVAFSPDEELLLVGGRSDRALVLRRDGGAVVRQLRLGRGCWGFAGVFSSDGDRAVIWENELSLNDDQAGQPATKVWDLKTGEVLRAYPRSAAALARGGDLAMEWYGSLWTLATGGDTGAGRLPRDADWTVRAIAPDARLALVSSLSANRGPVGLWDPARGGAVRRLVGHQAQVRGGAFTGDGRRVVTGGGEKDGDGGWAGSAMRLWDTVSAREVAALPGHASGVMAVAVAPDGRRAVGGAVDGRVILWELPG